MTDVRHQTAPGAPPPGGDAAGQGSDDCALVVAIGHYREMTPLRGPGPDAIRFATWLREKGGLKDRNIALVDANEQGRPVNADIRDALIRLGVRMGRRRGRRLYFYYAGHGLGPAFNDVAIVPADAAPDMLQEACYGLNHCIDFFVKTGFADELVVFMDCCREREQVTTIRLPFRFERPFEDATAEVNHFSLMAAGDGAKSFDVRVLGEDEERKYRGLMTAALLEGLNGAAGAIDANRNVTSTSLTHYVATRVQEEARRHGLSQTIDKPKPPRSEIVFLQVPKNEIPTVTLRLLVGPKTAGQPIVVQNLSTNYAETKAASPEGTVITLALDGNARYQLIIPNQQPAVLDPAELSLGDPDVQLP